MTLKAKAPDISEAVIQRLICDYLDMRGVVYSVTDASRVWDAHGRVRRSRVSTGWPDITCVIKGRFIGLEVKARTGRVRPEQLACHERLKRAGGIVEVVRSLDEVIVILAGI